MRAGDTLLRVTPPKVDVYNSVGCGDCFLAGMLHSCECGMALEDALRYARQYRRDGGIRALVFFDPARAEALMDQVTIQKL